MLLMKSLKVGLFAKLRVALWLAPCLLQITKARYTGKKE